MLFFDGASPATMETRMVGRKKGVGYGVPRRVWARTGSTTIYVTAAPGNDLEKSVRLLA